MSWIDISQLLFWWYHLSVNNYLIPYPLAYVLPGDLHQNASVFQYAYWCMSIVSVPVSLLYILLETIYYHSIKYTVYFKVKRAPRSMLFDHYRLIRYNEIAILSVWGNRKQLVPRLWHKIVITLICVCCYFPPMNSTYHSYWILVNSVHRRLLSFAIFFDEFLLLLLMPMYI